MKPAALLLLLLPALAGCGEAEPENMTAEEVADQLSGLTIEPGLWQLTSAVTDVKAPNLPIEVRNRMIGPRSRIRHCITPEQAAQPSANFLAVRADSACVYQHFTMEEGRLRGTMICPGATARMEGRYGPSGYDTRMEMRSSMPDGAVMTLQLRARGRRIGECEEGKTG